jgi:mRNA-degrading endonuclease RelE of RelBE toxin-antitoxin system
LRKIEYKDSVRREQRRIDRIVAKRILAKIEQELTADDLVPEPLHGPYGGLYKLRVGAYRVIYTFSANAILVVHIVHRSDAYR